MNCKCTRTHKCKYCIDAESRQHKDDRLDAMNLLMDVFGFDTIEEAEAMSLTIGENVEKQLRQQAQGDE